MPARPVYLDSSALVKLVVEEAETRALERAVAGWPSIVSSIVTAVELPLAARRSGVPELEARAREIVGTLNLLALDEPLARRASALDPRLRALDAIHLASALSLRPELEALVAYDGRLVSAGQAAGLTVLTPR